ncbi:GntR family transcriptional regulator [Mycobacterium intermedium]|uniref:GntR family transcriptional regulator n=1 Tax=Mycobacterium intermedium TaxID=28445 RepID=A0A1E3S627_MYCIE|nr:GntR family transcriptional regulator [Mycobacterium intermedium]MCV6966482.1 GntR family transcriptional regulator [Mycobacterium intermedium]ODQ97635.1 GntR family transcriptional regulator [Mycobacterium intermedium]OPE51508.1 GntR family transcriptional regulator [Mycobacterium intermedium]ORA96822.1 GntR family transcriptional regulator [Mycobacterium intermedium]
MLQLGQIDRADDKPPYRQIAGMLREAISSGQLDAGDRLPSEAELIKHFGVARMTVRQAMQVLGSEGLVVTQHGRGVFVRPTPAIHRLASDRFARRHRASGKAAFAVEAEKSGYTPQVDNIIVTREKPSSTVAERLRLTADDEVVVRSRRYLADGRPVETAISYIPAALAQNTKIEQVDTGPGGIYARLEDAGHILARFTEEVGARMPTPEEHRALQLPAGVPVLTVVRTAYDTNDVAVEVCDTVKVASAYLLEYDFSAR